MRVAPGPQIEQNLRVVENCFIWQPSALSRTFADVGVNYVSAKNLPSQEQCHSYP